MDTTRLFIAIGVPARIQKILAGQLTQSSIHSVRLRPVAISDMHVTLKFLGEIDDTHIPHIIDCLETVASHNTIFDIELESGMLLPPRKPRALSAGITLNSQLQKLYEDLEHELSEQGIVDQDGRRFNPHITLARIDGTLSADESAAILAWPFKGLSFGVEEIRLIESTLRPQGPLYTLLTSAPLQ